jgi:hypothetical protein
MITKGIVTIWILGFALALAACDGAPAPDAATQPAAATAAPAPVPTSLATPVLAQDSTRAVPLAEATLKGDEVISTNVGEITLEGTYLTDESIKRLADVQDYQRATEVYQWAFPFVEFNQWKEQATQVYGAGDLDFVVNRSFNERLGIVTANATTTPCRPRYRDDA